MGDTQLPAGSPDEPDVRGVDLARNVPETSITHEATRRRVSEGAGADRSWRVGADGEFAVAELLVELNPVSLIPWPRRKPPAWRVLHSVPVGDGRTDIDHVLIGPPGVVTINTEHHHHHHAKLVLDGVSVVTAGRLLHTLRSMTARLDPHAVDAIYAQARWSATWLTPNHA